MWVVDIVRLCYTGSRMCWLLTGRDGRSVRDQCPEAPKDNFSGQIIFEARNGYRFAKVVSFGTNRGHQRDEVR